MARDPAESTRQLAIDASRWWFVLAVTVVVAMTILTFALSRSLLV